MDKKKTSIEETFEKELKTLVSRMKNENVALNKILIELGSKGYELPKDKPVKANPLTTSTNV